MNLPVRDIQEYVNTLDLPAPRARRDGAPIAPATPKVEFTSGQEVVTVGAQLAEFSEKVPADLRPLIANSMLLAQLAADKSASQTENVMDWHMKYREVLGKVGWQVKDEEVKERVITDRDLRVHKAIIPVLTSLLGPAAAAASMVITVLKGLQEMDTESPWITMFDQQSQHARGAKFQISYVDADDDKSPTIKLLSCTIEADRRITQVLFFKFSSQHAKMHDRASQLSTNRDVLNAGKDAIATKVASFINDFVANIEI
jgi:hypothetical protein